jgi:glycosyltransferase involved in cell wall biosynthesis
MHHPDRGTVPARSTRCMLRPIRRPDSEHPRPFFEQREGSAPIRRRLLLISFVFPPSQESGSLRWQKLSRYIAERGWALDVVTLDPSSIRNPPPDPTRLADLPPGTRVYGVHPPTLRIWQIARAAGTLYRWLRARMGGRRPRATTADATRAGSGHATRPGSFARKDVRWGLSSPRGLIRACFAWLYYAQSGRWARDAAALTLRLIEPGVHEAVITSGPPHMAHEAGRLVSRKTGLPFIMDMRDPWSLGQRLLEQLASPLWLLLASRYERRAVAQAAVVVTNTEPLRRAMSRLYPEAAGRMITVMNGCDEGPISASRHGLRFIVAYAGTIYLDRDPRILFRAAARLIPELALTPADFGIHLLGYVDSYGAKPVGQIASEEGVAGFVTIEDPRRHGATLEFLAQATMLVSLPQDDGLAIPAKIFEYLRFDAWVLVLATRDSAAGLLLEDSGADVVAPNDLDGLVAVLRERFLQHRRGIRPTRIARGGRFSRREQADVLLEALAKCTARNRRLAPGAQPGTARRHRMLA